MTAETTPAIERGAAALDPEAFSSAHEEMARLMGVPESASGWSRDMARKRSRDVLAAALDVEEIAEAMARRATPQYWSDEHRDMLLSLNPDEARVDEILTEMRQGQIGRFRIQAFDFRATILGADS